MARSSCTGQDQSQNTSTIAVSPTGWRCRWEVSKTSGVICPVLISQMKKLVKRYWVICPRSHSFFLTRQESGEHESLSTSPLSQPPDLLLRLSSPTSQGCKDEHCVGPATPLHHVHPHYTPSRAAGWAKDAFKRLQTMGLSSRCTDFSTFWPHSRLVDGKGEQTKMVRQTDGRQSLLPLTKPLFQVLFQGFFSLMEYLSVSQQV